MDGMIKFLITAFPEFNIRFEDKDSDGNRWVHIGTDYTYLALEQATKEPVKKWIPYAGYPGVNHLGVEVDDVDALSDRLNAAGYKDSTIPNSHPYRKRVYFHDPDGNDWEFVQYLSDDSSKRNDYMLPNQ
jgi:catechol 2,3-dioxygenase-like lactoylglutathione lyase family enzyme